MYRGYVGTVFSHFLSLVSTIWTIFQVQKCGLHSEQRIFLNLALCLTLINSCLALFRYGSSDFGYKLRNWHIITCNSSAILSFGIIEAILHDLYKSSFVICSLTWLNIIPFFFNVATKDYRTHLKSTDFIIGLNGLILMINSFLYENYNGVALSLSYLFGYFVVGDSGCFFDTELPSVDAFQYLQCFLNFFIVSSITD